MTNQEAITKLTNIMHDDHYSWHPSIMTAFSMAVDALRGLPSAQPETATVTIGRTRGSVTMWYECDACGEPVDQKDNYCRKCGRKLKHE